MTAEELEAIEKACVEVTPGPWVKSSAAWNVIAPQQSNMNPDYYHVANTEGRDYDRMRANALFIAGARSWVPALLEEVKRLRALAPPVGGATAADWAETAFFRGAAEEREACARVAERSCTEGEPTICDCTIKAAAAIRARGK